MSSTTIIDLIKGEPSVEDALRRLQLEVTSLRRIKVRKVKVIHGMGKHGDDGSLRIAARSYLNNLAEEEKIKAWCPGEAFGPFEREGRDLIELCPSFRQDPDWAKQNDEISLLLVQ